ncbi:MAG: DUF423 domain-containing protein [Bacteroidetes bacterium]|nr:MAG: DUF423 domain-containing protein [Bacteroidota bacterium]
MPERFSRIMITAAALLGLSGVIAGAMGAHALESSLTPDQLDAFETAVRFQMYHAFLLLGLALLWRLAGPSPSLRVAGWAGLAGTVLFSGSIYLLVLSPLKPGLVTPLGGLVLMVAWSALVWWGVRVNLTR